MTDARTRTPANPAVPTFLRLVTWVECLVVFGAAVLLFFLPAAGREIWAWKAAPFASRYMGAVYFAALFPLVVFAASGRWSPGRVVLWMIFTFTTAVMIAMLIHRDRFEWRRPVTFLFWFLYLFLPVNSAVHLIRLRRLEPALAEETPPGWRGALSVVSWVLGLYGLALLIAPGTAASFWPWSVDAFQGRVYSATFLTPAVAAWLLRERGSASEHRTLGGTLVILGVFSWAGLLWTSATVPPARRVHFTAPGTLAYLALNLAVAALGVALTALAGRLGTDRSRPADDWTPATG